MKYPVLTALLISLIAAPAAAEGFSWTGSYEGHFVCDDVTAGAAGGFSRPFEARIIHSGCIGRCRAVGRSIAVALSRQAAGNCRRSSDERLPGGVQRQI